MEAGYPHPSHPQPNIPLKPRILAFLVVLVAAAASLPVWMSPASAAARAGQGLIGMGGMMAQVAAAGWSAGGLVGATAASGIVTFAGWLLAVGAFVFLCARAVRWKPRWARSVAFVVGITFLAIAARGVWVAVGSDEVRDKRLLAPFALVAEARTATQAPIFSNPSAAAALALAEPDPTKRYGFEDSAKATASVLAWRELNRSRPVGAVILAGGATETGELLARLMESPEWRLAAVDATGLLFLRGNGPAFVPSDDVAEGFPPDLQPIVIARTAAHYDLAGFKPASRTLMSKALDLAPDSPAVLTEAASLAASHGRWEKTRSYAEEALEKRPDLLAARYFLALALLETNVPDKALEEAAQLLRASPRDPSILLLHARCARRANDPESEIASLERLLKLLPPEAQGRIQIYLGQAWAKRGFAERASAAYEAALATDLTPAERSQVGEALGIIRSKRPPGN